MPSAFYRAGSHRLGSHLPTFPPFTFNHLPSPISHIDATCRPASRGALRVTRSRDLPRRFPPAWFPPSHLSLLTIPHIDGTCLPASRAALTGCLRHSIVCRSSRISHPSRARTAFGMTKLRSHEPFAPVPTGLVLSPSTFDLRPSTLDCTPSALCLLCIMWPISAHPHRPRTAFLHYLPSTIFQLRSSISPRPLD